MHHLLWDVRVSLDLFLGGLGIGAFLVGALLYYIDSGAYGSAIKKAFIVAPVAVVLGLFLLTTELGRPFNAIKTLYHVNHTSFMSIGIFVQGAFLLVSFYILFIVLTRGVKGLSSIVVYVSGVIAGLGSLYHGFLLTGIGITSWNNAIPIVFFVSSVLAGAAVVFILDFKKGEDSLRAFSLPLVLTLVLLFELVTVLAWVYNLALNSSTTKQAYTVMTEQLGVQFWLFAIVVGLLVPIVLFSLAQLKKVKMDSILMPASIAIITGSFFLKHVVVVLGQII